LVSSLDEGWEVIEGMGKKEASDGKKDEEAHLMDLRRSFARVWAVLARASVFAERASRVLATLSSELRMKTPDKTIRVSSERKAKKVKKVSIVSS
jgi:hypothetical protein